MSPKSLRVIVAISLLAAGAVQRTWARLPQAASSPTGMPKLGQAVDFQEKTRDHDGANAYGVIISQNAFRLVPEPPPAPAAPSAEAAQPATIKLTGLVQVAGQQPRAMFVSTPKDPKDTAYYNLSEGERKDELELVKIISDQEAAEVVHAGTRMTILLKNSKPFVGQSVGAPNPVATTGDPVPMASVIGAAPTRMGEEVITSGGAVPTRELRGPTAGQVVQPKTIEEAHILMAADALVHEDDIAAGKYPPPPPPPPQMMDDEGSDGEPSGRVPVPTLPSPPTINKQTFRKK